MNRLLRYLWTEDRLTPVLIVLLLLLLCWLGVGVAEAQTRTVVSFGDSALLITKTTCTTACDSALVGWVANGQTVFRTVQAKKSDTLRVKRGQDSLFFAPLYDPFHITTGKAVAVPPLSSVVALEFYSARGERLRGAVNLTQGDSMFVLSVRRFSDGTVRAVPVLNTQFDSTVLAVVRKSARGDTVWLVAK